MPAPFTDLIGTDSFTETLRQENLDTWLSATNHRFVAELFEGSIAPQVMAGVPGAGLPFPRYLPRPDWWRDC